MSRHQWLLAIIGGDDVVDELLRVKALLQKAEGNTALQRNPYVIYLQTGLENIQRFKVLAFAYESGLTLTHDDIYEAQIYYRDDVRPLAKRASEAYVGARREYYVCHYQIQGTGMAGTAAYPSAHGTERNGELAWELAADVWGKDSSGIVEAMGRQSFDVHHMIAKKAPSQYQ